MPDETAEKGSEAEAQNFTDVYSVCVECGEEFTLTSGEQNFFKQKGLRMPRRCSPCRQARRQEREHGGKGEGPKGEEDPAR